MNFIDRRVSCGEVKRGAAFRLEDRGQRNLLAHTIAAVVRLGSWTLALCSLAVSSYCLYRNVGELHIRSNFYVLYCWVPRSGADSDSPGCPVLGAGGDYTFALPTVPDGPPPKITINKETV